MIITVLLSCTCIAYTMAQRVDSLDYIKKIQLLQDSLNMRSVMVSVPAKARILFQIGNIYEENNLLKEAVSYFEKTASLPDVKNQIAPQTWYNLTSSLGMNHREMGNFVEAEKWLNEAVRINREKDLGYIGVYANLFDLYIRLNEFTKARAAALRYLSIAKSLNQPSQIGFSYYLLGRLNQLSNDFRSARLSHLKALRWYERSNDKSQVCSILFSLGSIALISKDYEKAKSYFNKIVRNEEKLCSYNLPYAISGLALTESEEGYPQKAMGKLNQVLTMFRKSGDKYGEIQCLQSIAKTQVKLKQYQAALKNALLSRELALSINDRSNINEITKKLPNLYAKNGKYKEAYLYAMQYQVIADSLYFGLQGLNQKFALQFQEREYESQLRQQALKNQYTQTRANRNLIGMILFGAIGVIIFLFYRNRTLRTEKATLVLREEARKKNEELRAFNHTIGHDLKSPVENMQMLLQQFMLKFAGKLDQESSLYLQKIEELNQDTRLMIDGLLKYAEQDQIPIQPGVFETLRILNYIAQTLRDANPNKNIVFKFDQLVDQSGDPLMLRHVFVNLLQNAVKFSSSKNPIVIEVSAVQKGNEREFCIKDNGVGFPPGPTERIFELFKTVHDRASFSGSGIGLAIVKRIIDRHGGRVWAEPNPEGGAMFRFSLPIA